MPETCNSRSLSWLVGSCIPKSPADLHVHTHPHNRTRTRTRTRTASSEPEPSPEPPISSLPDDLLLACLARAPLSSLPAVSAACRRFSLLLSSPHFFPLRRSLSPLSPSLFSLPLLSDAQTLIAAVHSLDSSTWRVSSFPVPVPIPIPHPSSFVSINNAVFAIGRGPANIRLDTWTARISVVPPTLTPRRKFAAAAVGGRIYVAGGSSRSSTVEIYDPEAGAWEVVGDSPTRRYGCIGAGAGEIFYVAGGLRVGAAAADARTAHAAAGTVDAYSVRTGCWARGARAVPGGGCIVGACGVGPSLYVIASNAVGLTLWRWEWEERGGKRARGGGGGEWVPLEPPPVQGRVGLGGAVRFSCCAVGEGRMAAAAVHVSSARGGGGQNGDFGGSSVEGAVLLYDVTTGEWSRGPDLPAGFRRAGLVCVEC